MQVVLTQRVGFKQVKKRFINEKLVNKPCPYLFFTHKRILVMSARK